MAKIDRVGVVMEGDYAGKSIYIHSSLYGFNHDDSFIKIFNDENEKISTGLFKTEFSFLEIINFKSIDHYIEVSSSKTGPDASAVTKGVIFGGVVGGMIGATATSQPETYDIAVYFKDGKKSLIRLFGSRTYQKFKKDCFVL